MKTKQYKTNINCLGCVEKVTSFLDSLLGEKNWEVKIRDKNKILTVSKENFDELTLIEQIKKAGSNIEPIK